MLLANTNRGTFTYTTFVNVSVFTWTINVGNAHAFVDSLYLNFPRKYKQIKYIYYVCNCTILEFLTDLCHHPRSAPKTASFPPNPPNQLKLSQSTHLYHQY